MKENEGKLIYEGKFLLILSCMTSVLGFIILFVQYIPLLKYGLVALIILIVFTKRKQVMSCASQLYKK